MNDKNFQEDFFEEGLYQKKDKKPSFFKGYRGNHFLPVVRITSEYTVIIAIGILVFIIAAYAIGIERGRKISETDFIREDGSVSGAVEMYPVLNEEVTDLFLSDMAPLEAELVAKVEEEIKTPPKTEKAVSAVSAVKEGPKTAYIIQLISSKDKKSAEREIEKLKKNGTDGRLTKSGEWYTVYAAGFANITEAQAAKKNLSKTYKDCYIKKVK